MNKEHKIDKQNSMLINEKKTYTIPKLIKYGEVRTITQAGTRGPNEASGNGLVEMVMSDRSVKENIVKIGDHPCGIGLYLFDFKPEYRSNSGNVKQFGVIADEVEKVMPKAVSLHPKGYKMVNYAMLGIVSTTC